MSPSNILFGQDLKEQLHAATDVSKVRKQAVATDIPKVREHRHPEGEGAHSLTNLNVKNLAGNFAEFNSKGAHSLPDLTNLSWRMKPGKTV